MDDAEAVARPTLGATVKRARQARGLTLRALGERVACSESMLSKIERGHVQPSLRLLHALAAALEVKVASLLAEVAVNPVTVQHAGTRLELRLAASERGKRPVILERTVPFAEGMLLDANLHVIPPGGGSAGTYSHDAEEVGYVVSGTLDLTVDGVVHPLRPGSSFHFNSRLPHSYTNRSDGETIVFWVNGFSA